MGRAGTDNNDDSLLAVGPRDSGAEFAELMGVCASHEWKLSIVPFDSERIYVNVNPLDAAPEDIADESAAIFVMHDPYPIAEAFQIARETALENDAKASAWARGEEDDNDEENDPRLQRRLPR